MFPSVCKQSVFTQPSIESTQERMAGVYFILRPQRFQSEFNSLFSTFTLFEQITIADVAKKFLLKDASVPVYTVPELRVTLHSKINQNEYKTLSLNCKNLNEQKLF